MTNLERLQPQWLLPIRPSATLLTDHDLIHQSGRIVDLLPRQAASTQYPNANILRLPGKVLMPGLVNCHGHAAMTLLRGYADDLALKPWLEDHIWPAEAKFLSEEFVADGTQLAIAEMVKSGTTCFADMYFFHEAIAGQVRNAGIRSQIGFTVLDFATPYGKDAEDYIHKGLALRDTFKDQPLIKIACAPHAPYTVGDRTLGILATYANELDMSIHIHCHETANEVAESLETHGCRPLERLNNLGVLLPQTQLVHMTQVVAEDIALVRDHGCHIMHCPKSNLKLASGFCPITKFIANGVNVSLGTDSAASNNGLDLFSEMQTASLLAKAVSGDATSLDAHATLRMATINGAAALGWDNEIGSLEPGKYADLIAVKIDSISQQPLYNLSLIHI